MNICDISAHYFFLNMTKDDFASASSITADIISILFCLPTNSYVIWLIVRGTGNGLSAEFLTLNLSICEMLFCMECFFTIFIYKCEVLWMVVYFLDGLPITGRSLFQCLMCVERYLAVVHPVTFLKLKPLRYRVICCVVVWGAGFISCWLSITTLMFFSSEAYFSYVFTQFLIFLSIQSFCLVAVLRALKQSGPGERRREKEENYMKRRAFHLILITTLVMLHLYVPYIILIVPQWVSAEYAVILLSISYTSFSLAGLVQPLLFLYRVGELPFMKCQ